MSCKILKNKVLATLENSTRPAGNIEVLNLAAVSSEHFNLVAVTTRSERDKARSAARRLNRERRRMYRVIKIILHIKTLNKIKHGRCTYLD